MTTTLVMAYGNPLCGDDGVAAAMVRGPDAGPTPPEVRVLMPQLLTLELAEDIARVERVVFVDAAVDGRPGTVRSEPVHPRLSVLSAIAEHIDPEALMGWGRRLFDVCPEA